MSFIHLLVYLLCSRRGVPGSHLGCIFACTRLESVTLGLVRHMDIQAKGIRISDRPGKQSDNDEELVDAGRLYSNSALELPETAWKGQLWPLHMSLVQALRHVGIA